MSISLEDKMINLVGANFQVGFLVAFFGKDRHGNDCIPESAWR